MTPANAAAALLEPEAARLVWRQHVAIGQVPLVDGKRAAVGASPPVVDGTAGLAVAVKLQRRAAQAEVAARPAAVALPPPPRKLPAHVAGTEDVKEQPPRPAEQQLQPDEQTD